MEELWSKKILSTQKIRNGRVVIKTQSLGGRSWLPQLSVCDFVLMTSPLHLPINVYNDSNFLIVLLWGITWHGACSMLSNILPGIIYHMWVVNCTSQQSLLFLSLKGRSPQIVHGSESSYVAGKYNEPTPKFSNIR